MSPTDDSLPSIDVLTITEVERQTGIRPATLRMWERRYGFPQPLRDRHGDRVYPLSQVERLQHARRLLDQGVRPGKIFAGDEAPVLPAPAAAAAGEHPGKYEAILALLRSYRRAELHNLFQYRLLDLGLRRFVLDFLAPLTTAVGAAWARGELPVRGEHLYTQLVMALLHAKQAAVRAGGERGPTVVLATLTGEAHALGIMMVEAVLASLEVECIQLGTELPPQEVASAAAETGADIVALSFSSYYPRREMERTVRALRAALPPATVLWVGGDGANQAAALATGIYGFGSLAAIEPALLFWRSRLDPRGTSQPRRFP